ncbi:hypothetical protein FJR48_09005 [Sulfurimonas lithotrophica]|uniref:Uncharacterized protein n=1 Tax=Sulfurimonas lithotrophica TaxID=2590022 RepID=A0A5P8P297_9BACT|nr:hypothetical protein [Sulfurimonas lithotrophica]QFR49858.1 hypothetical protein FJR48_09005 [Sulfurimonas lithotrophica]
MFKFVNTYDDNIKNIDYKEISLFSEDTFNENNFFNNSEINDLYDHTFKSTFETNNTNNIISNFKNYYEYFLSDIEYDKKSFSNINKNYIIKFNSSSVTNTNDELIKKKVVQEFKDEFTFLIKNDDIEIGSYTSADKLLEEYLNKYNYLTQTVLNEIFNSHYNNIDFICKFLLVLSRIKPEKISSTGCTMSMAALNHKSDEVKEYALRVFETFANEDALLYLQNSKDDVFWIQDFKEEIIKDIQKKISS